jgi:hypothetical protein
MDDEQDAPVEIRRGTDAPHVVAATDATLTVLDHHVHVEHTGSRHPVDLSTNDIRRIQLDLEIGRPAVMAIVPNVGAMPPVMLTFTRDQFEALAAAVLHIAIDLDDARLSRVSGDS